MGDDVMELVQLLDGGKVGRELMAEMRARFGAMSRADVFLAVTMAITLREADLVEFHALKAAEKPAAERVAAAVHKV